MGKARLWCYNWMCISENLRKSKKVLENNTDAHQIPEQHICLGVWFSFIMHGYVRNICIAANIFFIYLDIFLTQKKSESELK